MLAGIIVLTGITEIGHDWLLSDWFLSDWFLSDWLLNDWLLNESALNDRPLDESTSTCASQPSRVNCYESTVTSQQCGVFYKTREGLSEPVRSAGQG